MYITAIRAGDYYLFDEEESDDEETEEDITTITFGQEKDESGALSPLQVTLLILPTPT